MSVPGLPGLIHVASPQVHYHLRGGRQLWSTNPACSIAKATTTLANSRMCCTRSFREARLTPQKRITHGIAKLSVREVGPVHDSVGERQPAAFSLVALDDHGSRVAVFGPRLVVASSAAVISLSQTTATTGPKLDHPHHARVDHVHVAVLLGQLVDPLGKLFGCAHGYQVDSGGRVGLEIRSLVLSKRFSTALSLSATRTYHVQHGPDVDASIPVVLGNVQRAEKAGFLAGIPVELDWAVDRVKGLLDENTEGFEDGGGAGACGVHIGSVTTRRTRLETPHHRHLLRARSRLGTSCSPAGQVDLSNRNELNEHVSHRVKMRSDHSHRLRNVALARRGEPGDDRRLREVVREQLDGELDEGRGFADDLQVGA